jgi:hypothetical protein
VSPEELDRYVEASALLWRPGPGCLYGVPVWLRTEVQGAMTSRGVHAWTVISVEGVRFQSGGYVEGAGVGVSNQNWLSIEYYVWRVLERPEGLHEDRSDNFSTFKETVLPVVLRARFRRLALAGEPLE